MCRSTQLLVRRFPSLILPNAAGPTFAGKLSDKRGAVGRAYREHQGSMLWEKDSIWWRYSSHPNWVRRICLENSWVDGQAQRDERSIHHKRQNKRQLSPKRHRGFPHAHREVYVDALRLEFSFFSFFPLSTKISPSQLVVLLEDAQQPSAAS